FGIEVPDTDTDAVGAEQARLAGTGLASVDKRDTTCQTFCDHDHREGTGCCGGDAAQSPEPAASAARCC
ncbi:MAG TPA: hypothetical protein VH307_29510, partial [Streptosporangiaceae bacterium]|nr:hypothetical protein [Streptosporangiaceae bacterium]